MFRKTPKELTTEDAPDSIAPWEMLEDAGIADWTERVRERIPARELIAFAHRSDEGTLACFDKGPDGRGKAVLVLQRFDDPAQTQERRYVGFSAWFDDVLATRTDSE
jgi:hypothetical protein